jgi:hypothetical protein
MTFISVYNPEVPCSVKSTSRVSIRKGTGWNRSDVAGLLEENAGADVGFLQLAAIFDGGGHTDIHPANGAVTALDAVNLLDGVNYVVDGTSSTELRLSSLS